ncbi:GGDEF domain-containing protein [Arcobacter sp. CECT 8985]|uniref:GGDEF domain-containing protein n=1 Tax=Arcobacter sp. CECT 8985 TaxID=1935424 RepID=UPI00100A3B1E|nr:GGDEF domain-containing protein [Arcobacter sp. CECT 8985]RXJ88209.1 hypothetical protein CRU93_01030 [Arcobacter sp. CECT 8985]
MRKKSTLLFIIIGFLLIIAITSLCLYNLRNANLKSSIKNAQVIANVVETGLLSHMINGNTNQVNTFIDSAARIKNIEELWVVRSDLVKKQYGNSNLRTPKDDLDEEVLKTGKLNYSLDEHFTKTLMRVTVPFNATSEKGMDCTSCHHVNHGDTLGAVSMKMDISEYKNNGLEIIYLIPMILIFTIFIMILISRKENDYYLDILQQLSSSIRQAVNGKFRRIHNSNEYENDKITDLINDYNKMITTFKDTSYDIERKLQGFIGQTANSSNINPLEKSKDIIKNLSNLYQFKKEIELDNTKDEIYQRLSEVFINQYQISNFTFLEIDTLKNKIQIVKEVGEEDLYCKDNIINDPELCRCARTRNDVISVDFHHSCPYFKEKNKFHYCIDVEISKNICLIINFICTSRRELDNLKDKISFIKSYINEAAPSVEVKLLMEALQESAFEDGLTGLYNRKFLDEHSKKLIPQVKREDISVGVLLLDMDHFKAVNDEYGHDIGDKVLKELARILNETVRESDLIVRYGGEEFIVLLIGVNSEQDAMNVANKIRQRVRENEIDVYAGNKLKKTVSIGLSMFPEDSNNLDSVIKNADIALYEAKNGGRDQVVRFQENQVSSVDLF